jgi:hypothetical protein
VDFEIVGHFLDDPRLVGGFEFFLADWTRMVLCVPLLDAGGAIGVQTRKDHLGYAFQTNATFRLVCGGLVLEIKAIFDVV